ncbi:DISARM system helicase DrmA [Planotetraspora kaengkrachanensis]|uniref:Helicase n=1 Tax=Planotetraspora kaengkrachanensis TaxID=575193 RepID=A0A8J3M0C0_9ACTN|nr:DISARM system helicase DrmA [Planotetraspora kaengkrachanensis]GIG80030.1 helicase [Planotetraspora kaengkrachanensis]
MMNDQEDLFPQLGDRQQALELTETGSAPTDTAPVTQEVAPLDVPQEFADASSYEVRDEFQELVTLDLLGPWGGDFEEFSPRAMGPRERYLVGMLGPKHTPTSSRDQADEVPDTETGVEGDGAEADLPDVLTSQNLGRLWASSAGLSFAVPSDVNVIAVTASWGRYSKTEIETDEGKKVRTWAREPVKHEKEIRLDGESTFRVPLTGVSADNPGVSLAVAVRPRDGRRVVELSLINTQQEPASNKDTAWLFQAELKVRALDGDAAIFLPIDDPLDGGMPGHDDEDAHLRLLYRGERRYASGRNVAVHASIRDGERSAHELRTTWLPVYNVPATIAPTSGLGDVELSMDALASSDVETLRSGLAPLADGYSAWLDERAAEIPSLPEALRPAAENAVFKARRAAERVRAGIELLGSNDQALKAFRFANETMAMQRRHTAIAKLRQEGGLTFEEASALVEEEGAKAASWRPFQLAFVLLNLPSLTDPAHPERAAAHTATVDLLFFPTGGGKTEAYLGLTAYTFAIRRLQKVVGVAEQARSGLDGVAVLMRYTLRLLTAQQFQRAASLVCAAEMLRRRDEPTWGATPFRIGLWVGGTVSPNWFEGAAKEVSDARAAPESKRPNVLQTLSCPWCGEALRGHEDLHIDDDRRRVLLYCSNGEGQNACPFSRRMAPGEGLPILTVDEEIYRLTPSLVIATVDKLAQLSWRGFAGHLFGRVREWCPRHGYRHEDLNAKTGCTPKHNAKGTLPATQTQPVTRLRPPDLIIQDELHLISGALGTTVGLFEAAVDELCTWGSGYGPKIVASTATTKRADAQVLGVFARELAIFPPQVIDVADTFFSRQVPITPKTPGRRYLGVCAHGVRLKSAEIRLAEILLIAGQTVFDRYGRPADPYMTLVGYFNATRELAGMRRYVDDQVTTRVRSHGKRKGLSNRLATRTAMLAVQELTSRISSTDISEVLRNLEVGFDPEFDTSRRKFDLSSGRAAAIREKRQAHSLVDKWLARNRLPSDVVLATSMLQVGVDVSRFGLMVVTGQPKNTAEYIQASSRVGRDSERPGLVVTLYNWSRPRDLAHFEDFEHYHATFYRQVEALSVTPYTRRALDRGVTAAFVAALRNAEESYSRNTDAHDVPLDGSVAGRIRVRFLSRAEAVAGERGRDYLRERLDVVTDRWNKERTGQIRLGYQASSSSKQPLMGLLHQAGEGPWDTMTVGQSMRETENEINLLVPRIEEMFAPAYGAPEWAFTSRDVDDDDGDAPEGDELGETALNGKGQ